ncbi:MAG: hypothetical protein O7G86_15040 [Gammaproteobacteria bacterium]|nr:hypothetical protein [Gammaproteobacteria bacterium]
MPDCNVPLVVGVTGHRDLVPEEVPMLRKRVLDFFHTLNGLFPGLSIMVMTPLAEGADRLVADVAKELGFPIIVLLPMERRLYQADFQGESLAEFQDMMELGETVELPLVGENTEADIQKGAVRDLQYAQLGAYLAAHSHILLALWDGKLSTATGGTGLVVQFHQHDIMEVIAEGQRRSPIDFAEDESDLVYHIVCSRREDGGPLDPLVPGEAQWLTRDDLHPRTDEIPVRYHVVFQRMSEFNEDLRRPIDVTNYDPLIDESADTDKGGASDIAKLYQSANSLAERYQRLVMASLKSTYTLIFLAGLSFIVYADLPDVQFVEYMIYPYLTFIALVLLIFSLDRRGGWHRKHLDYRSLAEALRVQFYWSMAGVKMTNPSRFSHDSFLRRQDLELGWIRNVMRFAGRHADAVSHEVMDSATSSVAREWVGDDSSGQTGYYRMKSSERSLRAKLTSALGTICFVAGVAVALALAVFQIFEQGLEKPMSDVLIALMGLLPLLALIRQNYAHRTAEHELFNQYAYMYRIFSNAHRLLDNAATTEVKRDILRARGESALDEQGQWILRQRERPLSVAR